MEEANNTPDSENINNQIERNSVEEKNKAEDTVNELSDVSVTNADLEKSVDRKSNIELNISEKPETDESSEPILTHTHDIDGSSNDDQKSHTENSQSFMEDGSKDDASESGQHSDDHSDSADVYDFEGMDKQELLDIAEKTIAQKTPRIAFKQLNSIKAYLLETLRKEKQQKLQAFIQEGGEPENFVFDEGKEFERFNEILTLAKDAREQEKLHAEQERQKNYQKKLDILKRLKDITDSDETLDSIKEVKELQKEWREIRVVPKEHIEKLYSEYNFYLDKFYDNHSINIELKNLDKQKNLEKKIDLCMKVDALKEEVSLKKSFILLKKYQEDFRNTGPVPREANEEIWKRFKETCDVVYELKREEMTSLESQLDGNLIEKRKLIEKASIIGEAYYEKVTDWRKKSQELEAIMEEWKKIGPVPKKDNEPIWKEFRSYFNKFYDNKNDYFKELNKERKANLILKEELVKRAESIKDNEDFNATKNELIQLQKEWKEIGPVPDKVNKEIWERFRNACDAFFKKFEGFVKDKKEEESKNLAAKIEIIEKVKQLAQMENGTDAMKEFKTLQSQFKEIGFVPFKDKDKINKKWNEATDKLFDKFKDERDSMKSERLKEHYDEVASLGFNKIKGEEIRLRKKITALQEDIHTWENNMAFFANSKGANKLKEDFEKKVEKVNSQISKLKKELKLVKNVMNEQKEEKGTN